MVFAMSFKAFARIAFIAVVVWLFNLDVGNMAMLGINEDEVAVLEDKLAFSDEVVAVLAHAGGNITFATYLASCPSATAMVVAHEAWINQIGAEGDAAETVPAIGPPREHQTKYDHCFRVFSEHKWAFWQGVSGGIVDSMVDDGMKLVIRWLEIAEGAKDPLGPRKASEIAAGVMASSSRVYLRLSFGQHRAFGVLSTIHGFMGELGLVPVEVNFRALLASRDGSYVRATIDLIGAHAAFWGNRGSPAMSMELQKHDGDGKCPQKHRDEQDELVFKGSDGERCRWWKIPCRLRRLGARIRKMMKEAAKTARETARVGKMKAREAREARTAKRQEKRQARKREREARKQQKRLSSKNARETAVKSMENGPDAWILGFG